MQFKQQKQQSLINRVISAFSSLIVGLAASKKEIVATNKTISSANSKNNLNNLLNKTEQTEDINKNIKLLKQHLVPLELLKTNILHLQKSKLILEKIKYFFKEQIKLIQTQAKQIKSKEQLQSFLLSRANFHINEILYKKGKTSKYQGKIGNLLKVFYHEIKILKANLKNMPIDGIGQYLEKQEENITLLLSYQYMQEMHIKKNINKENIDSFTQEKLKKELESYKNSEMKLNSYLINEFTILNQLEHSLLNEFDELNKSSKSLIDEISTVGKLAKVAQEKLASVYILKID